MPPENPRVLPPPPASAPLLQFRDADLGYDRRPVLRSVDLAVAPGECLAVTGPNGAGKTTLLRAALGLADVLAGEVHRATPRWGYVPQRHSVAAAVPATVAEVVAVGRLPLAGPWRRWAPSVRRADRAAVAAALEAVGLADRAGDAVARLSGGQQRRVLLARALATESPLLLLDEPTAGVDALNQQVIATVLRHLRDGGAGLVVITHDVEALAGVCTRRVEVGDGLVRPAPAHPDLVPAGVAR